MKGRKLSYSPTELAWIKARAQADRAETHAAFCAEFGRSDVSLANLNALCKRKGWLTGRDGRFQKGDVAHNKGKPCAPGRGGRHPNARKSQFKRGQLPHNTKWLCHERISKDGYVEISVAEVNPHTGFPRRYVLKHRWLWEQAHGPVPEGMALKCLGERTNCDPSNWELVPRALLPRLDGRFGRGFEAAPDELRPIILAAAKVEHAVREKRRDGA